MLVRKSGNHEFIWFWLNFALIHSQVATSHQLYLQKDVISSFDAQLIQEIYLRYWRKYLRLSKGVNHRSELRIPVRFSRWTSVLKRNLCDSCLTYVLLYYRAIVSVEWWKRFLSLPVTGFVTVEIFRNTQCWQCWHFYTTCYGNKLGMFLKLNKFNANLNLLWCFEIK